MNNEVIEVVEQLRELLSSQRKKWHSNPKKIFLASELFKDTTAIEHMLNFISNEIKKGETDMKEYDVDYSDYTREDLEQAELVASYTGRCPLCKNPLDHCGSGHKDSCQINRAVYISHRP